MDRNDPSSNALPDQEAGSLEGSANSTVADTNAITENDSAPVTAFSGGPSQAGKRHSIWHKGSIYLLVFGLLFVVSLIVVIAMYANSRDQATPQEATIKTQDLSAEALKDLADNGGLRVGDAKQVLNIQSNTVFAGAALVRGDLQIGGNIRTGGSLNLTGLTVSGPGTFQRLQAQELVVAGRGSFTGPLSTQGAFTAAGGGNFGGAISTPTLNANTLQLSGNLVLNNHIQAGGARPSASGANALGNGGTTNVSGSDTAGTITINTGGGPTAGCFTNVRFARNFSSPRVNVTPVGGAAGGLQWYVNRGAEGFSVCTNSAAPASQSFAFDYFIVD